MNKAFTKSSRALVVSPQGLGDLIMIFPVLRVLESHGISYDILLKDPKMGAALLEIKFSPSAIFYMSSNFKRIMLLFIKLRFNKYDFIFPSITINSKKFLFFYYFVCMNNKNIFNIFSYLNIKKRSIHIVKKNLFFLFLNNIKTLNTSIKYSRLYSSDLSKFVSTDNRYIVIAPGSGKLESHKRWPYYKFSNLCIKILDRYPNISIKIIGSNEEADLCQKIFDAILAENYKNNSRVSLIISLTSLQEILSIYVGALLAIVNCNGGSHIAGYAGIPILGLYGPTNPNITGPLGVNLKIIQSTISCSPCYSEKKPYGCDDPICMDSITLNEAWNSVNEVLGLHPCKLAEIKII